MSVVVEVRRPSRDGRLLLLHPRPAGERADLIALAHLCRCQAGMSYRATQRALEEAGAKVGIGTVWRWVNTTPPCEFCNWRSVTGITVAAAGADSG